MRDVCWPNTWRIQGVHKAYTRRKQGTYKAYTRRVHGRHKAQSLHIQAICASATRTRARVARVRAEYPSQLDYSGVGKVRPPGPSAPRPLAAPSR